MLLVCVQPEPGMRKAKAINDGVPDIACGLVHTSNASAHRVAILSYLQPAFHTLPKDDVMRDIGHILLQSSPPCTSTPEIMRNNFFAAMTDYNRGRKESGCIANSWAL